MIKFSIIVPVYNVEKYLNKCLDSVVKQTYKNYEVIIVCDKCSDNSEDIVDMQKNANQNIGFDAKNGEWVDMFEKGIIDPTKVSRSALLNAASISALFITTEAGVAEIKSDEPAAPAMAGGMY